MTSVCVCVCHWPHLPLNVISFYCRLRGKRWRRRLARAHNWTITIRVRCWTMSQAASGWTDPHCISRFECVCAHCVSLQQGADRQETQFYCIVKTRDLTVRRFWVWSSLGAGGWLPPMVQRHPKLSLGLNGCGFICFGPAPGDLSKMYPTCPSPQYRMQKMDFQMKRNIRKCN